MKAKNLNAAQQMSLRVWSSHVIQLLEETVDKLQVVWQILQQELELPRRSDPVLIGTVAVGHSVVDVAHRCEISHFGFGAGHIYLRKRHCLGHRCRIHSSFSLISFLRAGQIKKNRSKN